MNVTAINTLAALLENIPSRFNTGFNMNDYKIHVGPGEEWDTNVGHECGSTACIAGWASQFLKLDGSGLLKQPRLGNEVFSLAEREPLILYEMGGWAATAGGILGLDLYQAECLFEPMNHNPDLFDADWEKVTPRQAAKVLRRLAKTGEVDWEVAFK